MIFSRGGSGVVGSPGGGESKIFWHDEVSYVRDVMIQLMDRSGKSRFQSVPRSSKTC